ncbi:MAG: hypothetical protein EZS28_004674 [Streblomastix strix]|uniref:Uncharacterized protein n=1 Tax=Streblomastix strix TaxID=222440 RepID=A0A5J4WY57_9EUKA|nr:MAG: hypothetical protein EZS28_004674 [Streblomastix strix]
MLNIVLIGNRIGQGTRIQNIGSHTTMNDVAQHILSYIGAGMAKLSFVVEFGKVAQLIVNQNEIIKGGNLVHVETLTGFLVLD